MEHSDRGVSCVINQEHGVDYVSFSPTDPQYLLYICKGKVRQWDIDGHQAGHEYDAVCAAFSSDGSQFVSCYGGDIVIQNSSSGEIPCG